MVYSIAKHLLEHSESLANDIVQGVLENMKLDIPQSEKEQALEMYRKLLEFFGESLSESCDNVPETLIAWSVQNAEAQVTSEGKISDIVIRYGPTRVIFTDLLTELSIKYGLSLEENAFIIKRMNTILDVSINETVTVFERLSDQYMREAEREMAELSAPVVPIREGVAVLPLIGTIDDFRANYILENVVPTISTQNIDYVIVDFSGLPTIDTHIAHYLRQIGDILQLLGIEVIVTGIRPELARTVVEVGIDMGPIKTYAHVKQALESI